jgi:leader peptidase (prepilin peptidase) / N-methyltransferase
MSFYWIPAFVVLGWLAGLIVNYLSDVLPMTRSFSHPACLNCDAPFSWADYLLFRRCLTCGKARSWRVGAVQVLAVILVLGLAYLPGMADKLGFWAGLALLIYFGVVIVIDLEYRLILHPVSLVGAVLCGLIGVWRHGVFDTVVGGAAGFGFMFVVYWLADVFIRSIRKRRGIESDEVAMGFGDVNLSGILGLLLGWPGIVGGLVGAVLLGGLGSLLVVAVLVVQRRFQAYETFVPYGPYLVIAAGLLIFRA